jgi:hypothetical protein
VHQHTTAGGAGDKRVGAKPAASPAPTRKSAPSKTSAPSNEIARSTGGSQTAGAPVNGEPSGSAPSVAQTPAAVHVATSSRSSLPLVIGAVAAGLVIALLFLDGLGYGPRHQPRRGSWLRRRTP